MAKFAKIGLNNVVERLVYMSNLDTMNDDGVLDETFGKEKLEAEELRRKIAIQEGLIETEEERRGSLQN